MFWMRKTIGNIIHLIRSEVKEVRHSKLSRRTETPQELVKLRGNQPPQVNCVSAVSAQDAERTRLDMNISSRVKRATVRIS